MPPGQDKHRSSGMHCDLTYSECLKVQSLVSSVSYRAGGALTRCPPRHIPVALRFKVHDIILHASTEVRDKPAIRPLQFSSDVRRSMARVASYCTVFETGALRVIAITHLVVCGKLLLDLPVRLRRARSIIWNIGVP